MLSDFPKAVTKTKIARGHYRLEREDGYVVEMKRAPKAGEWWVNGMPKKISLSSQVYDMRMGYTARDRLEWTARAAAHSPNRVA